ncbi:hypothetical protein DSCW_19860 [Desulfosarcina widdelii]|uniref:Uncharacterized protein n=1 Tax=Desulfosarcina widdelii TaxID=947919 RepID=A0A5K7Z2S5_9BACT|nr:hypothetical protein DSCW_19860 [Desulfosarcina widdelii]
MEKRIRTQINRPSQMGTLDVQGKSLVASIRQTDTRTTPLHKTPLEYFTIPYLA